MSRVLPILLNTDMVRAILDRRKTVTRRVVKPHNAKKAKDNGYRQGDGLWVDLSTDNGDREGHIKDYSISPCWIPHNYYAKKYAPYQPGDILYVRETWNISKAGTYLYKTDNRGEKVNPYSAWRPSIHMPKAAARIWLRVTDVRTERLHNLNNNDAKREGVMVETDNSGLAHKAAFMRLWDSTIKKSNIALYGWDANPWVWVIKFERCEKPQEEAK